MSQQQNLNTHHEEDRAGERELEGKIEEQTQWSKVDNGANGKDTLKIGG